MVIPGHYQVRLTVRGSSQTAPLEVVQDPRLEGQITDNDVKELADLSRRTSSDIDDLHKAVNQIREVRARWKPSKKWEQRQRRRQTRDRSGNAFDIQTAPIEGRLLQVKIAASEDELRYPTMLMDSTTLL